MTLRFDLINKAEIPAYFLQLLLAPDGRQKLEQVQSCFTEYPDVLNWIGALAGIHQSPIQAGVSTDVNIGKQDLFRQILAMIAAADLTEDQVRAALNGQ